MIVDILEQSIIIEEETGGKNVKYIVIALGVVVLLWLVSLIIQNADKRARERLIKERQEQRKREEEAKERLNRPNFPTS